MRVSELRKRRISVEVENVPAIDAPEEVLAVSFVGLTLEEQRRAIAGFPGGKRFRLVEDEGATSTAAARRGSWRSS